MCSFSGLRKCYASHRLPAKSSGYPGAEKNAWVHLKLVNKVFKATDLPHVEPLKGAGHIVSQGRHWKARSGWSGDVIFFFGGHPKSPLRPVMGMCSWFMCRMALGCHRILPQMMDKQTGLSLMPLPRSGAWAPGFSSVARGLP